MKVLVISYMYIVEDITIAHNLGLVLRTTTTSGSFLVLSRTMKETCARLRLYFSLIIINMELQLSKLYVWAVFFFFRFQNLNI